MSARESFERDVDILASDDGLRTYSNPPHAGESGEKSDGSGDSRRNNKVIIGNAVSGEGKPPFLLFGHNNHEGHS